MYSLEPTPPEVSKALAERHRILRKQLKMSQEEMAERSGVSLGSLKRFEVTGKISLDSLLKLPEVPRVTKVPKVLTHQSRLVAESHVSCLIPYLSSLITHIS